MVSLSSTFDKVSDERSPKNTFCLLGHKEAEEEFLHNFNSGHLHHAWLISGPKGIGKATFAYRVIRYIFSLANSSLIKDLNIDLNLDASNVKEEEIDFSDDYSSDTEELDIDDTFDYQSVSSKSINLGIQNKDIIDSIDDSPLKISPSNPICERLIYGGIADLKIIEREYSDTNKTKLRTEILVKQIRELKEFFSKTSSEGGYRIALIDSVDDLNTNSANALLKILEEAPAKSLLLLICNNYENVIDTIKSRCRLLKLKPLNDENMNILLKDYINGIQDEDVKTLTYLSDGSIGNALEFYHNDGINILKSFYDIVPGVLSKDNKKLTDLILLIGNSDIRFNIFKQIYIKFLDNIIKEKSNIKISFTSSKEENVIKLCSNAILNTDKIFKIREDALSLFELVSVLNLDYTAVIFSVFERLKNAYR